MSAAECMVAICQDGIMRAASVIDDIGTHDEALSEWARDPEVTQILRVPVEVPRKFLFEPWPGLEAALAAIAKAEHP